MKLFVLVSRIPYPLEKGDKLRAYHQIKLLAEKHEVFLCCLNDAEVNQTDIDHLKSFCSQVEVVQLNKALIRLNLFFTLFSNKPFQVRYFYQRGAHKKVSKLIQNFRPDHIYCQLIRASEYVKNEHDYPKTLDYMDAFSKGIERRIDNASFLLKPIFKAEARRLIAYENLIFEYFENKTIISQQDREVIFHPEQQSIKVIPNGVDTEFFTPRKAEKKYDLVFIGNMNYAPNVDSVEYLVKQVLPLVHQQRPETTVFISGATPAKKVLDLASDKITISGWVEDIRDSYASACIFVAPMQIGTGLQNKLLEAMAMNIPCITSELANNALGARHGENILIGNVAQDYATHIIELLNNETLRDSIAAKGHEFVKAHFNWEATTQQLEQIFLSD
jgi:sugar transferase (PEP-CTERM/EpsH1 system associated)